MHCTAREGAARMTCFSLICHIANNRTSVGCLLPHDAHTDREGITNKKTEILL